MERYKRYKDNRAEWIGEIPEGWEVKRLRYVGNCQNGVSKSADYFGTGFPFVRYSDVYNNLILPQNVEGLANSTEIDQVNYSVIKGDILRLWYGFVALGADHGNQQLIRHNDSVWTPYVMLRAPLLGVKTAL